MYDEETTFEYNAQGQLIKETVSINGDMIEYSNFTYGPNRVKLETFNYVHAPRGTKEYFFDERPNPLAQTGIVATGNFNNDRNYSELIPMPNNVIQYIETEFNGDTTGNSYTAHINFNEKGAATYKYLNYRYSPSGSVEYRYECK